MNELIENDFSSILTQITPVLSRQPSLEPICITFLKDTESEINFSNFLNEPEVKFKIENYYKIVENSELAGFEKYKRDCHKYNLAPIESFKNCFLEEIELDLNSYGCGSLHIQIICDILTGPPVSKITHLNLSNTNFDKLGCHTLCKLMEQSMDLKYLNLSNTLIGSDGVRVLTNGISASQSIVHFNFSKCNLRDAGGATVAISLRNNGVCKFLDLSYNKLSMQSGVELGQTLENNAALETLLLGWNELFPEKESIIPLINGLRLNTSVKYLDLSWNALTGKIFCKALNRALLQNKTIECLNLENNRLQTSDAGNFKLITRKSKSLKYLYIGKNLWSEDDILMILRILTKNPNILKMLSLGDTYISQAALLQIGKILKKNPNLQIIHGGVIGYHPPATVDLMALVIDRCKFLAMKPKKKKLKRNMGHFMLKLKEEEDKYIRRSSFIEKVQNFKLRLDEDLVEMLMDVFTIEISSIKKGGGERIQKFIGLSEMSDYYLERHPTDPPPPVVFNIKHKAKGRKKPIKK